MLILNTNKIQEKFCVFPNKIRFHNIAFVQVDNFLNIFLLFLTYFIHYCSYYLNTFVIDKILFN